MGKVISSQEEDKEKRVGHQYDSSEHQPVTSSSSCTRTVDPVSGTSRSPLSVNKHKNKPVKEVLYS